MFFRVINFLKIFKKEEKSLKLNIEKIKQILLDHNLDEEKIDIALSAKKFFFTSKEKNWHLRLNYEQVVDIPFCVKMYEEEKVPIYKLAMAYGVSDVTLREYMIKHGAKMRGHACGKNSQNDYFEKIDTRDKAYFLGLIAADGSVVRRKKSASLSIELIATDGYILDKFNQYGNFDAHTFYDNRANDNLRYVININSTKVVNDLEQYGIIQNKSHKDSIFIPEIDPLLIPHFIRGYYDGDGIAKKQGYIGFCGSKTIIWQIHDYFVELYGVNNTKITYNSSNHIYYCQWGKLKDTMLIADVMYNDSTDLYLLRKQEKIFYRLRPVVWRHTELKLSKPTNIGCPSSKKG